MKSPAKAILQVEPETRLRLARVVFDWSCYLLLPILVVTWLWPRVGFAILQGLSVFAVNVTMWDVMITSDVRNEQD